jgi:hypothetical protein
MGNILYLVAVMLVIIWLIGFVGLAAAGMIHILPVIALLFVLVNIIAGSRRKI